MTYDLDQELRAAFDAEVAGVTAGDELWERILATTEAVPEGRSAHRHGHGPLGRRSRWYLVAAAAAAIVVAAAVAITATRREPGVTTNPGPPPPTTATTTTPPTTASGGAASAAPTAALAVLRDGRMVRVDLTTGKIVAEYGRLYSPDDPPAGEGGGANAIGAIDVAADGSTLMYTTVGEPAKGNAYRTTLADFTRLGEAASWGNTTTLAISPDGRFVAHAYDDLVVSAPDGGEIATLDLPAGSDYPDALWWSPDGTRIAYRTTSYHTNGTVAGHTIRVARWDGADLTPDTGSPPRPGAAIRWAPDGGVEVLPGDPLLSRTSSDGQWTLVVAADESLHLLGSDGEDTPLFAGTRFQYAEPIDARAGS